MVPYQLCRKHLYLLKVKSLFSLHIDFEAGGERLIAYRQRLDGLALFAIHWIASSCWISYGLLQEGNHRYNRIHCPLVVHGESGLMSSKTAASSKAVTSALRPSNQANPASVLFSGATLPPVVLASQSPRRKELLETLGFEPEIVPAQVDEALFERTFSEPKALATALSQVKCRTVAKNHPNSLVIAADTVVVVEGQILGKPTVNTDAERMLEQLQGRQHQVISSISVSYKGRSLTDCQTTLVTFNTLDPDTIASYVATGEPLDKAGAYAIQGLAGAFIDRVDGCYFNVVGLSLSTLRQLVSHLLSAQS